MDLKKYFGSKKGLGVLSTADEKGKVNAALYSKPHVIDDKHVAFIMADRLTHANTNKNPYAIFLFKEEGSGYKGQRLYLKKLSETEDQELIAETCKIEYAGSICEPRLPEENLPRDFFSPVGSALVGEEMSRQEE